jgi:sulfopyruvate decarboxylase TPP-binding subunit
VEAASGTDAAGWPAALAAALADVGAGVGAYVPDKRLAPLLDALEALGVPLRCLPSEEECVGYAAGSAASGERPLVLLQCSGLGNALNALGSLVLPYGLGLPLVVSMRGTLGEANPSQMPLGRATRPLLEALGVQVFGLRAPADAPALGRGLARMAYEGQAVAALLLEPELDA